MVVRKLIGWVNPRRLLTLAFRLRPNSEFIIFQGQRLTRRQVLAHLEALAAGLQTLGVREGDRVASLLPARPEAVYALFLPWVLGNVNVPLNPLLRERELRHILADCGAKVVITTKNWYGQDHAAMLARLLPDLPDLRYIIVCDGSDGNGRPLPSVKGPLPSMKGPLPSMKGPLPSMKGPLPSMKGPLPSVKGPLPSVRGPLPSMKGPLPSMKGPLPSVKGPLLSVKDVMSLSTSLRRVRISLDDVATISYTSGTTGLPKGVVHTRRRALGLAVRGVRTRLNAQALRCMLLPYPPCHTAGRFGIFIALLAGGKAILMDRPNPRQMLEYIQDEKVTQIAGSPTMCRLLLRASGQERYDLSSVQRIALSSESLQPDLAQALRQRMGCHLENMYGTTETMMISWTGLDDSWERAATTVGKPAPGARVRIVDDERQPLPVGERGEIAAQTAQMMTGYYRDPELTAQFLDAEGWFYTGDIGYVGEDGYLRIVGRKKDIIIRGGQNIYPAEVERYLELHPAIRRASVIGVPHDVAGEVAWSYLELQPGATLTATEVLNHCREQLAPFNIPAQVRFVERLPKTAAGKVKKFELREMAAQEMGRARE